MIYRVVFNALKIVDLGQGMHNIRPAEAFNLARETPNFVYFASFFDKYTLCSCVETYQLWHLDKSK